MAYDPDLHHRRSIRLTGRDYAAPGAYFVTLRLAGGWAGPRGEPTTLAVVEAGQARPSATGSAVAESWLWLAERYPFVALDAWIVIPNHLHGILVIRDSAEAVEHQPKPLGRLVAAFKTVSTRRVNELLQTPGAPLWQRNYYEHIVRNDQDLEHIRWYLAENPRRWSERRAGS